MSARNDDDWRGQHKKALENNQIKVISRDRGQGVIDPRDQFAEAPEYGPQPLPQTFLTYVDDCVASWGGDKGAYACGFLAMHCSVLHSSVKVNTNPLKPNNYRNPNDFSLSLGKSGENKSGMLRDLTRHQEAWQKAMTRAASASVSRSKKQQPPMCYLQNASIEGMMMQVADNKGDRLLMGSEEAMSFYDGAAIHHKDNGANAMSNAVCQVYDGGMYSKRLVNNAYSIPEALATLIMTTTIDKITGWKAFATMVDSGLMARHTVGVIAHVEKRNPDAVIPGADEDMADLLLKMRGLRDVRLVLAPDARQPWLGFTTDKEESILKLVAQRASEGFINWSRKYDMRIMTAATILQLYDFIEGGQVACAESEIAATEADTGKTDGGKKLIKTVEITLDNLERAIDFVEGYLTDVQEFFYRVAAGQTEFGKELLNFLAYRVTMDEPDNPSCRIIGREYFTHKGPAVCRGAITDSLKETHNRYIQALLDHGYIEVYDHPRARAEKKTRRECEERWFKVRDEVFEYFSGDGDGAWLKAVYTSSREAATGTATRERVRLRRP